MSDLIGKTLGPYRILEQIGVGGMATVYKAYQPSMDRYVAIKVLPHYLSTQDEQFLKRFQREARAIAKLEHAHILPVYDYGEHESIPYLAMRYVEAGTLKELIARGPLALDEINRIVGQVGSALDYAHRLGVIHRDVKPGNVLIDDRGDTYLTDFGLARMMEASQHLTASGVGVGTPAYMSPEQSQGVKVDHRSDIYSLGVILYEMVTGRVPYEAETPMAVMLKHITDPLPLPRTVAPDVPEAVELVVLKALAKDPAHRYQTAGELVEALTLAVRKTSSAEVPQPTGAARTAAPVRSDVSLVTRVQKLWQTPRGKAALVGGGVVAVVGLGFLLNWLLPLPVAIVGPGPGPSTVEGATATPDTVAQTNPTREPIPTRTPRPTQLPIPTSTPNPLAQGERLEMCATGSDLCIVDSAGNSTSLGLAESYRIFPGFGLSPDGSQIAFTACSLAVLRQNPDQPFCHDLFIRSKQGGGETSPVHRPNIPETYPAWSPDGKWIAFGGWSLALIRPDGTGLTELAPNVATLNVYESAWSPDSQRIAYVSGNYSFELEWGFQNEVSIINRDGSDWQMIFSLPDPKPEREDWITDIAWSADGQSIAIQFDDGRAYLLDPDCEAGSAGCVLSDLTVIPEIPQNWLDTFNPQWISATAAPTATPNPLENGQILDRCGADVCVFGYSGGSQPLELAPTYVIQGAPGLGWSPDGSHFVFSGCLLEEIRDPARCIGDIYIASRDGKNVTPLMHNTANWDRRPTWSPDGEWIAYEQTQSLVIIRVDGTGKQVLWRQDGALSTGSIAWSPDSQRLAWVAGPAAPNGCEMDRVRVINRDGTEPRDILSDAELNCDSLIAWSPDGDSVAVLLDDGTAYQIDAKCYERTAGCDVSSRTQLDAIPEHWLNNFYPQWAGELEATVPPQAAQARAFAEPILQAIADRPPDFADDFSTANSRWYWIMSNDKGQTVLRGNVSADNLKNGALTLPSGDGLYTGVAIEDCSDYTNFVMQADLMWADVTDGGGEVSMNWRVQDNAEHYRFTIWLNLIPSWEVAHFGVGIRNPLASGIAETNTPGTPTRVLIVAYGSQFAIYLNGSPLTYVEDAQLTNSKIGTCNFGFGPGPMTIAIDNVKAWNLDNVPGLPSANTLNPQAAQARAFAEPILAAIANRDPDFEDDFSDAGSGWEISSVDAEGRVGDVGYSDGEYFIVAGPASTDHRPMQNAVEIPKVQVSDFVLEMDIHFILAQLSNEEGSGFYVHFPVGVGPPDRYGVEIDSDGLMFLEKETVDQEFLILARIEGDPNRKNERQHLRIVVKGTHIAVFLGEQIAFLVEDEALGSDKVSLGVTNNGSLPLRVHVDNLKLWDISNLP